MVVRLSRGAVIGGGRQVFFVVRALLILGLVALTVAGADMLGIMGGFDRACIDLFFRLRGEQPVSSRIVVVAIDEKSLDDLGRWPIDRAYYALLLDRTRQADAVGLDLILSEPSTEDAQLATAIQAHGRVVLPSYIDRGLSVRLPVSSFKPAATGHVHVEPDIDGIARTVYHRQILGDQAMTSFSLALYRIAEKRDPAIPFPMSEDFPHGRAVGHIIQLQPMLVEYYGGSVDFQTVSLSDVLDDKWSETFFANKIVLVGATAPGLDDRVLTPFMTDRQGIPGVVFQAQVLNNLLMGQSLAEVAALPRIVSAVALGSLCFLLFSVLSGQAALYGFGAILFLGAAGFFLVFVHNHLFIAPSSYLILVVMSFVLAWGQRFEWFSLLLDQAERDWENVFHTINDAIVIRNVAGQAVRRNKAAQILGEEVIDAFADDPDRFPVAPGRSEPVHGAQQKAARNRVGGAFVRYVPELERFFEVKIIPQHDRAGQPAGSVQIVRDVTAGKAAEEERQNLHMQLIQAQKMEAIGRLTGGIAHDFNNFLMTIMGYCELSMERITDPKARQNIRTVYEAGEKAATLTRQLLTFSRRQPLEVKIVNVNQVIEDFVKIMRRMIGEDIHLNLQLDKSISNVKADPGQLEQILMNLVVNARDALPNGGTVTILSGQIRGDSWEQGGKSSLEHVSISEEYVFFSVQDDGVGMSETVREQIFEPFFTTKKIGHGTGLGLATVHGIVVQHGGMITCSSTPGLGTQFQIFLPAVESEVTAVVADKQKAMPVGKEVILVVDDEVAVLELVTDTLQPLGYRLVQATSGEEALVLIEQQSEKVDLLLTDLVLAGMSGLELYRTIKARRPELRFLLMSGYSEEIVERYFPEESRPVFLSKPLLPGRLAAAVREELDRK